MAFSCSPRRFAALVVCLLLAGAGAQEGQRLFRSDVPRSVLKPADPGSAWNQFRPDRFAGPFDLPFEFAREASGCRQVQRFGSAEQAAAAGHLVECVGIDSRSNGDFLVGWVRGDVGWEPGGTWRDLWGPVDHLGVVDVVVVHADGGDADPARWVVWDEYRADVGESASFDVVAAPLLAGGLGPCVTVADGPRFQARPSVVADGAGGAWVAWEEGADGWGGRYRSVDGKWNNATDTNGPLHSWRELRLARLDADGRVFAIKGGVPMPSFELAAREPRRRVGAEKLGVYYERPELAVGESGALWLAFRHMHAAQISLAEKTRTHVERGFDVDLLALDSEGWQGPFRLPERQRDGGQGVIFLGPAGAVVGLAATHGREDRREEGRRVGETLVELPKVGGPPRAEWVDLGRRERPAPVARERLRERRVARVGGRPFTLLFGDLHRHTDLSLCFPYYDGSLDDAYRYARGPGELDFLAVTDHARDLDRGRVDGTPWARSLAAMREFHRPGRFVGFASYERSQGNCDHNVIPMREDALRPHTPPLTEFWAEFPASEVLTIPHATAGRPGSRFSGDVWQKRDDARRPLAEIYQAYRDVSSMTELQVKALARGQKLGFIASSDHLATSGAYACVWSEGDGEEAVERSPIFNGLASRRTYGATARISLAVTSGEHWMGEDLEGPGPFPIEVSVTGTGSVEAVEFWSGGVLAEAIDVDGLQTSRIVWSWEPPAEGPSYCFVRVVQADGERAWSSPFFHRWE